MRRNPGLVALAVVLVGATALGAAVLPIGALASVGAGTRVGAAAGQTIGVDEEGAPSCHADSYEERGQADRAPPPLASRRGGVKRAHARILPESMDPRPIVATPPRPKG